MKHKCKTNDDLNFKYRILNTNNEFIMLLFSKEELKLELDYSLNSDIKSLNFSSNSNYSIVRIIEGLSSRELECTKLLMKGKSNVEITRKLSLSATTVSTYKKRVLQKTKTKNIVELTKLFNKISKD
jgi:DNA-binding CsgD family transcriptional regulator